MQTQICHFYYVNIQLKCHKFAKIQNTGIFQMSSLIW